MCVFNKSPNGNDSGENGQWACLVSCQRQASVGHTAASLSICYASRLAGPKDDGTSEKDPGRDAHKVG